jgi:hypothetical protein
MISNNRRSEKNNFPGFSGVKSALAPALLKTLKNSVTKGLAPGLTIIEQDPSKGCQ